MCPPRASNPAGKKVIMKADMYTIQTKKREKKSINAQHDLAQRSEKDSFGSETELRFNKH